MTLNRRRFLTITAGAAIAPVGVSANTWHGRAFGADTSITIRAQAKQAEAALTQARQVIRQVETQFSLYDPSSALSRLNRDGRLKTPDLQFLDLMNAADAANKVSGGLFDPTVQPLWRGIANGHDPSEYLSNLGWGHVSFDQSEVILGARQALTFNGIAQGYATDKVTEVLKAHGLQDVLVNIGEYRAIDGPWTLALNDPEHGDLGHRTVTNGAIATSSPNATPVGKSGHIVHSKATPLWSTVSVEAPTATVADGLSTAMVLATRDHIEAMIEQTEITRVTLISFEGDLITI